MAIMPDFCKEAPGSILDLASPNSRSCSSRWTRPHLNIQITNPKEAKEHKNQFAANLTQFAANLTQFAVNFPHFTTNLPGVWTCSLTERGYNLLPPPPLAPWVSHPYMGWGKQQY
jgi:hypothetical protein